MNIKMTQASCNNAADYQACKAIAAYLSGDFDAYAKHIAIADALRIRARWL